MKVTKKAINKALPSIRYFNKWYVPHGFAGMLPENASTLASVVFRVNKDGDVVERDYAIGDAKEPEDYRMGGVCVDASDVIENWMRGNMSRNEVVETMQIRLSERCASLRKTIFKRINL